MATLVTLPLDGVYAMLVATVAAQLPTWNLSRFVWDAFPALDSRQLGHLSYAVGSLGMDVQDDFRQRSPSATGGFAQVISYWSIRYSYRIRADPQSTDYQAALSQSDVLSSALLLHDRDPAVHMRLTGYEQFVVAGDFTTFIGDVRMSLFHKFPLR